MVVWIGGVLYLQTRNLIRLKRETNALKGTYRASEKVVGLISKCVSKLEEIKYSQKLLGVVSDGVEQEFQMFIRD